MREIDLGNGDEKARFTTHTIQRLDRFMNLDDTQPFEWSSVEEGRIDPVSKGWIPEKKVAFTLEPGVLHTLKTHAIASEFRMAQALGAGDVASFILKTDHEPKKSQ